MTKKFLKRLKKLQKIYSKILPFFYLLLSYRIALADSGGVIPISNVDQTADNTDFSTTLTNITQQDILPLIEIGGAAVILFVALNGLWSGYKDYQKDKNMDHLKSSVISSVILIVVGGAVLYLLDRLRTYNF
jgi:hypothetical protein